MTPAAASSYPARPLHIAVGVPAGGPLDLAARIIGPWLSDRLGQSVIIDNLPGDHSNIAARAVVKAAADGHTLLLCGPIYPINGILLSGLDFEFANDIAPVAGLFQVPLVVEVNPLLPINTAQELLAYARAHPGKLRVVYAGIGTPQHIGIELFKAMAGVELTLIPHLGSVPALADLMAGKADAMFDPMPSSVGLVRSGKLRPLAVTSTVRSAALPDVPIMSDLLPGYEAGSWFGIGAPRGTPTAIIERLNAEINRGLADPSVKGRIAEIGGTELGGSAEDFGTFMVAETAKYARVIRAAGITAH